MTVDADDNDGNLVSNLGETENVTSNRGKEGRRATGRFGGEHSGNEDMSFKLVSKVCVLVL